MAKLRTAPLATTPPADFPIELCRGSVAIETFVHPSEPPPVWKRDEGERWRWREFTAWRRWQHAVEQWGRDNGLDRKALMAMHVWPCSPMWLNTHHP